MAILRPDRFPVTMLEYVHGTILVNIEVFVPPVAPGPEQSPEPIYEPKAQHGPARDPSPDIFQPPGLRQGPADGGAPKSQQYGTPYMSAAAEDRPEQGLCEGPSPRLRQRDERQVMIRAGHSVKTGHRDGSRQQNFQFSLHVQKV